MKIKMLGRVVRPCLALTFGFSLLGNQAQNPYPNSMCAGYYNDSCISGAKYQPELNLTGALCDIIQGPYAGPYCLFNVSGCCSWTNQVNVLVKGGTCQRQSGSFVCITVGDAYYTPMLQCAP
jgi:hypothetical protein